MNAPTFDLQSSAAGVAHLSLCRPERMNTFEPAFFPAFRDAVLRLSESGQTRVLVISSTGKHFSAGMSLDVFGGSSLGLDTGSARSRLAFQTHLRQLMHCFDVLEAAHFPVIAAVQGGCVGGALDLATACDLRLCRKSTSAWPPTWVCCSGCPRSCHLGWRERWPTPATAWAPSAHWPAVW